MSHAVELMDAQSIAAVDISFAPTPLAAIVPTSSCNARLARIASHISCWVFMLGASACRATGPEAPSPAPQAQLAYAVVGSDTLRLHHFGAPRADSANRPAVLLLHGGGWSAGEPSWVYSAASAFAAGGFEAFAVQYRLSEGSTTPLEAIADVCAALRWTRLHADSLRVDASRVALYGVSAGGHLAASTVTIGCPEAIDEPGADALLLLSPAVDVEGDAHFGRLLQGRASAREVSPAANGRAGLPPTVLVQGAEDSLTPLRGAQRFCLLIAAQRQTCDLRVYDGLGHLLGRNLGDQENAADPDPAARADALRHQLRFLQRLWLADSARAPQPQ
ncbi:MAG: alpha/beta hydrolase [Gemmatimonas sp.]|nr:alpha/beta hydrolase [Gemmatimonas sp.]